MDDPAMGYTYAVTPSGAQRRLYADTWRASMTSRQRLTRLSYKR